MFYKAQITRENPTAILFLIDLSSSMNDKMPSGESLAEFVAKTLNETLEEVIASYNKGNEVIWDYFQIGVITYRGSKEAGDLKVENGFQWASATEYMNPLSKIHGKKKMQRDKEGIEYPVWFEPVASGGTPMCQGITTATEVLTLWCAAHKKNFPPTVIHITDGASTDGPPESLAEELKKVHTDDGPVLLFNLHVCAQQAAPIRYPSTDSDLPNDYSKLLFRMSSVFPNTFIKYALDQLSMSLDNDARGFVYNASAADIHNFFDVGTKASAQDR
jgi:hypothetical protein